MRHTCSLAAAADLLRRRPTSRRTALRWTVAILASALACAAAAPAASAGTPYVDGISDQNLGLWSGDYVDGSGLFSTPFSDFFASSWVGSQGSQHLLYARFVTAPDTVAQGGACEQHLYDWFTYVTQTLHLIPVISVWDVPEGGCADTGAPSPAAYTNDIQQLLTYLDGLYPPTTEPYVEAWNEPNQSGLSPSVAAGYWTAANTVCANLNCTAIAGDFVDNDPDQGPQTFNPGCAANLTYTEHLEPYETQYVTALGAARPAIWGFHPYYAVNCEQSASITTFEDNLPTPSGQTWFTEVGAWECVGGQSPPRGVDQQNADAQYLVNTLMSASSPTAPAHVFWYEMAAPKYTLSCSKYADSELYEASSDLGPLAARPAAATVFGSDSGLGATSDTPSEVTSTQATFNGTVTPAGVYEASYSFQYGPTAAYGSQTDAVALGPGLTPQPVGTTVAGLTPGTAYHYRLVVTDTNGSTVDGADTVMEPVAVAASTASITAGEPLTVSWSGISNPASTDWIGLYQPGAAANAYVDGFYAGGCTRTSTVAPAAAGSCSYTMPATPGTYELRLYAGAATDLLTSSSPVTSVPPPPVNSALPVLSGASGRRTALVGDTLSCSFGAWSNSPTAFVFEWSSDNSPVAGATGQTFVAGPAELGQRVSCGVSASNAGGTGTLASSAAVAVASPQPVSEAPPGVSGRAIAGERLVESHGTWSNSPTSFTYRWKRCDRAGNHCEAIAGATARTYTLTAADVGATIRVFETARNARAEGAPAASHPTAAVDPAAPNTVLAGETIDGTNGVATFRLRATGRSSGFECALVREPARGGAGSPAPHYARCGPSATFAHLQAGRYMFYARAVGPGGADPEPVRYSFVIP